MSTYNMVELENQYSDPAFRDAFRSVYAIRSIHVGCIHPAAYRPNERILAAIQLSGEGARWEQELLSKGRDISAAEARVAIFHKFGHDSLLIDPQACDLA